MKNDKHLHHLSCCLTWNNIFLFEVCTCTFSYVLPQFVKRGRLTKHRFHRSKREILKFLFTLSRLRRRCLVRGFIYFLPFLFPCKAITYWLGILKKVNGLKVVIRGFLRGNVLCPDHSFFYSCLDLIVLGSTLRIYFCPGQERWAKFISVLFQDVPAETSGSVQKATGFFLGLLYLGLMFLFSSNMSPDVCVASPRIGTNTGVFSRE